jgi:hypothetical protein
MTVSELDKYTQGDEGIEFKPLENGCAALILILCSSEQHSRGSDGYIEEPSIRCRVSSCLESSRVF